MNKKLQCIKRMLDLDRYYEIIEWLVEHKLATPDNIKGLDRNQERAEFIYITLLKAEKEEKLILLYFEWELLPLETIKITCATENEKREFTHGY